MKEPLIDLETAKIAKEKGFKESCFHYFSLEGEEKSFKEDIMYFYSKGENGRVILRPTQSLLQKWLRESHNIYVNSYHDLASDGKGIQFYTNWGFISGDPRGGYDEYNNWKTYEESLEHGLQEALKLIP